MTLQQAAPLAGRLLKVAPTVIAGKGRGVVAQAPIRAGELIDEACTVPLENELCDAIEKTPLGDHYFAHPADDTAGLLVLGLPSLCNHDDDPNAGTSYRYQGGLGWVVVLTALRDIGPGEEITRRYACPIWFTAQPQSAD
jgi:SET domain-containing protein